jgi:hypothetical protein
MGIFDSLFKAPKQKSTTSFQPSKEQQQLLTPAMGYLQDFAQQGVQLPTETGIADFNPTQLAAQGQALGAAGQQNALAGQGMGFSDWLFSGAALDPNSNPALQATIDASTRPIFEGLMERVMPQIRSEARTTGNMGSSRQGIAEGLASREASRAAGDTGSRIAYQGYQSGLDAMMRNLGLLPQTLGAMTAGAATTGAVGDAQYGLEQGRLTEEQSRYMQQQLMPLSIGQELLAAMGAIPGGTMTSKTSGGGGSPFSQILGAGSTLLGMR